MADVGGVVDSQSDCEKHHDGGDDVDRVVPEVQEANDVNLKCEQP